MDLVLYNISLDWANQNAKTCFKLKRLTSRVNIVERVGGSGGFDASYRCAGPIYISHQTLLHLQNIKSLSIVVGNYFCGAYLELPNTKSTVNP